MRKIIAVNKFLPNSVLQFSILLMELRGKTALITGSTGQLGRCITTALAEAGCNCICHFNRNRRSATELAEKIKRLGLKAQSVGADLSYPDQIRNLFEKSIELDRPSILINSAAIFLKQPLSEITSKTAGEILGLNLIAPVLMSRYFTQQIQAEPSSANLPVAKIVNMADVGGIRPWVNYAMYCASKAALISVTKSLAKELAPAITVNAVAPGLVSWPESFNEAAKERQLSRILAGRAAQPQEITAAVMFLLQNDYITGHILTVDGGRVI